MVFSAMKPKCILSILQIPNISLRKLYPEFSLHVLPTACLCMSRMSSVISSYLLGGNPPLPPEFQIPPVRKTPKIQKNIKKCIEFTPQICVPPRTWSLELTLRMSMPLPFLCRQPTLTLFLWEHIILHHKHC